MHVYIWARLFEWLWWLLSQLTHDDCKTQFNFTVSWHQHFKSLSSVQPKRCIVWKLELSSVLVALASTIILRKSLWCKYAWRLRFWSWWPFRLDLEVKLRAVKLYLLSRISVRAGRLKAMFKFRNSNSEAHFKLCSMNIKARFSQIWLQVSGMQASSILQDTT